MIQAKYKWEIDETVVSEEFLKLAKPYKLDQLTSAILYSRGVNTSEALEDFLHPSLENLHDPFLLHDMKKATDRILSAVENGENILIYGDYDADGMTAASVMKTALDELGAEVQVYLPNRFTDGYGPNLEVYQYFINQENINLIITVDNGVAGRVPIAWAQEQGVDVIVTDHHALPAQLPNAYAIIHPEHPESTYPFRYLAGVGVAFKVACALLEYVPREMLDLVAIGTVADMVSLTDENRVLVAHGLKVLAITERIGLQELMKIAGVDFEAITEETIGFQIAPRLNALGRLDDPNPAIELLTGWDEDEGLAIAQMIDEKNVERKAIVEKIYQESLSMLTDEPVQVLYHKGWHKGVLGIVAGRLLEKIHKPVVLLAEEDGLLRGSARSIDAFNIFEALDAHRELFIAFGGHKQAAGMTLTVENVAAVKAVMIGFIAENKIDMSGKTTLKIAGTCDLSQLSLASIKNLNLLAPFGMDNIKPRFLVENFKVTQSRSMGKDNSHLKLKIEQNKTQLDAVYFGHGIEDIEFEQVPTRLAVTFSVNNWNGNTNLQLMIEDAECVGIELIDIRSKRIDFPEKAQIFTKNELKNGIMEDVLVVEEVPSSLTGLSVLKEALSAGYKMIYFKNKMDKNYYLTGCGTREQFAKLYKAIYQFPEFDIRYKLKNLADYLKIPEILLIKMIQIFDELKFIKINNGIMTVDKTAPKREISESQIFQELQATVKLQELFALAPVKEIYQKLTEK